MNSWPKANRARRWPAFPLLGHIIAAAAIFVMIYTLSWMSSVVFNWLNAISQFEPGISDLAKRIEFGLFVADCVGSGIYLAIGMIRIMWNSLEGQ